MLKLHSQYVERLSLRLCNPTFMFVAPLNILYSFPGLPCVLALLFGYLSLNY